MRNKSIIVVFGLIVSLLIFGCEKDSYQPPTDEEILGNVVKPEIVDEYIYPIQPGMPEWADFDSHMEMIQACELPDSVLKNISTWGLLETCFKYPLRFDIFAFNIPVNRINRFSRELNGLIELFKRDDAPTVLLYYYRFCGSIQKTDAYPDYYDRLYQEYIIGCDLSMSKLSQRQLIYLVSLALEKVKEYRESGIDSYFLPNSFYIMANAMNKARYRPFIDYCASNSNNKEAFQYEFSLWGFTAKAEKIEEYANAFVSNPYFLY